MAHLKKPDSYTDADWLMVRGYMDGYKGGSAKSKRAAYMHGFRNGLADLRGVPADRADVLKRRADMIPGITPQDAISQARETQP